MEEINKEFVSNDDEIVIKKNEKIENIFNKNKKLTKNENRKQSFVYGGNTLDERLKLKNANSIML